MQEFVKKFSGRLIFIIVLLSAIVGPLFFLPTTSEFFEFNKYTAMIVLTILGYVIWSAKMVVEKRFTFTKTPLDIPLVIFIVVFFVASLTSIDQFSSLVGTHGRIWPGFFPMLTVVLFYFLTVSNIKTRKQVNIILWTLISSTTIAAIITSLAYFGLFAPFGFAKIRSFNPLGIINRLALLESFIIPIPVYLAIFSKHKIAKFTSTIVSIIIIFSLVITAFFPAYVAAIAGVLTLALGSMKTKPDSHVKGKIALLATVSILFVILRFVPQVSSSTLGLWVIGDNQNAFQKIEVPREITIPLQSSWDIAAQAVGKRPLFGTGPATFKFAYTQLKPRSLNSTDSWIVRFEKSSSDFTEFITTIGVLGILAYLYFIFTLVRYIFSLIFKSQSKNLYLAVSASIVSFIVSSFIATSSFGTAVPFFLVLALLSVLAKSASENHVFDMTVEIAALKDKLAWFPLGSSGELIKTSEGKDGKSQILPTIFLVIVLVSSFFALNYQIRAYIADVYFRKSLTASLTNDGNKTIENIQRAIVINPAIDTYHRTLSQATLNAALNLSAQKDLTQQQKQLLTQLAQVAVDQGKIASGYQISPLRLPGISAINVANWEVLAAVYQSLTGSITGAEIHAVNTLNQAVNLDPQNPILHDRLGLLYQLIKDPDSAQRKFEDTIIVKGDFGPAHYHLAKLLIERKGDVQRILNALTLAKRFLPANDPAIGEIDKSLETYANQLKQIQENPQPQTSNQPSPTPSASTNPTPSPSPTQNPSL